MSSGTIPVSNNRVVDEGTSSGWHYRKWANNFYECWYKQTFSSATFNASGNVYYRNMSSVTFPVTFSEAPNVYATVEMNNIGSCGITAYSKTSATASVLSAVSTARAGYVFYYVAGFVS